MPKRCKSIDIRCKLVISSRLGKGIMDNDYLMPMVFLSEIMKMFWNEMVMINTLGEYTKNH